MKAHKHTLCKQTHTLLMQPHCAKCLKTLTVKQYLALR